MAWFTRELFDFLEELAEHNDREWFAANKARYEAHVKGTSLAFVEAVAGPMADLAPHIRCDKKALFRIYRDTRFSKDKTPYKTTAGIHFRHDAGKDAHAPGYYLHLEPAGVFVGSGIWSPDTRTAGLLRSAMVEDPQGWAAVRDPLLADGRYGWYGDDALKRVPRGYPKEHPLADDLRKKSIVVTRQLPAATVFEEDFLDQWVAICEETHPLMAWICRAIGVPW